MPERILYETPWVKLKETPRGFQFLERKGRDSVAIFLVRRSDPSKKRYEVLMRHQPLTLHNPEVNAEPPKLFPCPVTGGIEEGESPANCARRETLEETGYDVALEFLGTYLVGTQTNERVHMYWADVTGLEPVTAQQDGTYFESISKNEWHPLSYLMDCEYSGCQIGFLKFLALGLPAFTLV